MSRNFTSIPQFFNNLTYNAAHFWHFSTKHSAISALLDAKEHFYTINIHACRPADAALTVWL